MSLACSVRGKGVMANLDWKNRISRFELSPKQWTAPKVTSALQQGRQAVITLLRSDLLALPQMSPGVDLHLDDPVPLSNGYRITVKNKFEGMTINSPIARFLIDRRSGWITEIETYPLRTEAGFFSRPRIGWSEARALACQALRERIGSQTISETASGLQLEPQELLGAFAGYRPSYGRYGTPLQWRTDAVPVYTFHFAMKNERMSCRVRIDARRTRVIDVVTSSASPTAPRTADRPSRYKARPSAGLPASWR